MKFSANLGLLWIESNLEDAVRKAAAAGFDAVEFHWPYHFPAKALAEVISGVGLSPLSINTAKGGEGQFGLCALPGAEAEAQAALDQAIDYALALGATSIHAMAGISDDSEAGTCFARFIERALPKVAAAELVLLIEPINTLDVPGYVVHQPRQAMEYVRAHASPFLKLMYDCYHAARMGCDLHLELEEFLPWIGHIQIAATPDRGEPDLSEVNYPELLSHLGALGYSGYIGAEYRPRRSTDAGIGWLEVFRHEFKEA